MKTYHEQIADNLKKILKINNGFNQEQDASFLELRTIKPNHNDKVKFVNLGPLLGKKLFNKFVETVKKELSFSLNQAVYSRICVEVSQIDSVNYIQISLNKICQIPIAGSQYRILEGDAKSNETDIISYVDSLNFILDDSRNFDK